MVGPFVNNLPVRATLAGDQMLGDLLAGTHDRLLQLNSYQFVRLSQIQSWSDFPWQHRLFDSPVVVQNYVVDESARRLSPDVASKTSMVRFTRTFRCSCWWNRIPLGEFQ